LHVNDALRNALQVCPQIDILKIDTEGAEVKTVEAIDIDLLQSIHKIFLEASPKGEVRGALFSNRQYGYVRQLTRRDA
jgi:hypothetical protein